MTKAHHDGCRMWRECKGECGHQVGLIFLFSFYHLPEAFFIDVHCRYFGEPWTFSLTYATTPQIARLRKHQLSPNLTQLLPLTKVIGFPFCYLFEAHPFQTPSQRRHIASPQEESKEISIKAWNMLATLFWLVDYTLLLNAINSAMWLRMSSPFSKGEPWPVDPGIHSRFERPSWADPRVSFAAEHARCPQ